VVTGVWLPALLAAAVLSWPAQPAGTRVRAVLDIGHPASVPGLGTGRLPAGLARLALRITGARTDATAERRARAVRIGVVVAAATVPAAVVAGPGGALAAAMICALGVHRLGAVARNRGRAARSAALLDAVAVLVGELRAGAHPAVAAAAAAESASPVARRAVGRAPGRRSADDDLVQRVLRRVEAGARLGADVPALLLRYSQDDTAIGAELAQLAAAWGLAERHGVALADLLDAVRLDLESRARLTGQIGAQLAGPRSTAAVLAALPVLGILLGQGVGAAPWHVLTTTPLGQLLLVVGVTLTCAGVLWTGRITAKAAA
jgi:tight adherence protein B